MPTSACRLLLCLTALAACPWPTPASEPLHCAGTAVSRDAGRLCKVMEGTSFYHNADGCSAAFFRSNDCNEGGGGAFNHTDPYAIDCIGDKTGEICTELGQMCVSRSRMEQLTTLGQQPTGTPGWPAEAGSMWLDCGAPIGNPVVILVVIFGSIAGAALLGLVAWRCWKHRKDLEETTERRDKQCTTDGCTNYARSSGGVCNTCARKLEPSVALSVRTTKGTSV